MLKPFKRLFEQLASGPDDVSLPEDELRLAAAALLVHVTKVDGVTDSSEQDRLQEILSTHYGLTRAETTQLIQAATQEEQDAVDLYRFTSVITRHLGQPGRQKLIELLWEMVFADGVEHEFEANLVWRVAELLGVSTNDRIALKHRVKARLGI